MTSTEPGGAPPLPPRTASGGVIALGVFNIVYAILFRLCCGFFALFSSGLTSAMRTLAEKQGIQMPQAEIAASGPMQSYAMMNGFVVLVLGILLFIGGIGLLTLKPWGRSLSLGVAAAEIVWVLIDFGISVFFVYPAAARMMGEQMPEAQRMIFSVMIGIVSAFVQLIYPVVLLIFLNLRTIKQQFEPVSQGTYPR